MEKKTRLGIFLFFDDEGYVDDYVKYLLDDIKENFDKLVIVCNGILSKEGREILSRYSSEIFVRPNIGFDAGGFREVIVEHLGFERVSSFDEVVLFNDSFFGPLYPFKEVFAEMDSRPELDYWSLSSHGETGKVYGFCPYGYRPRYIQTYFVAFRKPLVQSTVFRNYWIEMPVFNSFEEAAEKFGCYFTKLFEDEGFKWAAYSDTSDLESEDVSKNMSYHTFNVYDMLARRRLPVIKRKTFVTNKMDTLRYNWGGDLSKAIKYIKDETDYDVSMIYRYLLRKYNLDDLKKSMNWTEIFFDADMYNGKKLYTGKKIAVIAHTFYEDLFDYTLSYLKNVPEEADIIVTNSDDKKINLLEQKFRPILGERLHIVKVKPRGRDLSALLVGCKDYLMKYDYLCFVHDKKSAQKEFSTVGSAFSDLLWDNVLHSRAYIQNILNRFENEPCLGLMVPPNVYHGTYYSSAANYWTICFDKCRTLLNSMGIEVPLDKSKEPFSVGSVFWCRTDALKNIFTYGFDYRDFPQEPLPGDGSLSHALERIFPYVAQHNGYYTECIMNSECASAEITNYRMMHTDTLKAIRQIPHTKCSTYSNMILSLNKLANELRSIQNRPAAPNAANASKSGAIASANSIPTIVYQEIGLKAALIKYAKKKLPKPFYKILSKVLKYDC